VKQLKVIATALLASGLMVGTLTAQTSLDPKAVEVLEGMGTYMGSLQNFTLEVHDSIDKVDEEGRLLTFHHDRTIHVRRPDRLVMSIFGDLQDEKIYYDGKNLTVALATEGIYAQTEAAPTIEQTIELMREKYGIRRPLLELLHGDLNTHLEGKIQEAVYVGLSTINGKECHHVALHVVEGINWQLWIENDDTPVPAKVVVHYAAFPGEPRYIMQLREIDEAATLPDELFTFVPAAQHERIPFEVPAQVGEKP
jgi:hypothetical protein